MIACSGISSDSHIHIRSTFNRKVKFKLLKINGIVSFILKYDVVFYQPIIVRNLERNSLSEQESCNIQPSKVSIDSNILVISFSNNFSRDGINI